MPRSHDLDLDGLTPEQGPEPSAHDAPELGAPVLGALGRFPGPLVAALLALLILATLMLLDLRDSEPVSSRLTTPPLPREWRWEKEAVQFEHMFRESESAEDEAAPTAGTGR